MAIKNECIGSGYFNEVLKPNNLRGTVERIKRELKKSTWKFDVIACQGLSGMSVALPLGFALNVPVVLVRKTTEGSHAYGLLEGVGGLWKYIIIDDFPETGKTIDRIIDTIDCNGNDRKYNKRNRKCKCVGAIFYNKIYLNAEDYKWKFPCINFAFTE